MELKADREWFHSQIRWFLNGDFDKIAKPDTRNRLSSCRFLLALDAALRHVSGVGSERFRTSETPLRQPLPDCSDRDGNEPAIPPPTITVVVDQHSVGWSAGLALCYKFRLRSQFLMDPSHRFARDIELALKASNL